MTNGNIEKLRAVELTTEIKRNSLTNGTLSPSHVCRLELQEMLRLNGSNIFRSRYGHQQQMTSRSSPFHRLFQYLCPCTNSETPLFPLPTLRYQHSYHSMPASSIQILQRGRLWTSYPTIGLRRISAVMRS